MIQKKPPAIYSPDDKLSCGLTGREAIEQARAWWDKRGRHLAGAAGLKAFNKIAVGGKTTFGRGPMLRVAPSFEPLLPSGILRGLPWEQLTRDECLRVVRGYLLVWQNREIMTERLMGDPSDPESVPAVERGLDPKRVRDGAVVAVPAEAKPTKH